MSTITRSSAQVLANPLGWVGDLIPVPLVKSQWTGGLTSPVLHRSVFSGVIRNPLVVSRNEMQSVFHEPPTSPLRHIAPRRFPKK